MLRSAIISFVVSILFATAGCRKPVHDSTTISTRAASTMHISFPDRKLTITGDTLKIFQGQNAVNISDTMRNCREIIVSYADTGITFVFRVTKPATTFSVGAVAGTYFSGDGVYGTSVTAMGDSRIEDMTTGDYYYNYPDSLSTFIISEETSGRLKGTFDFRMKSIYHGDTLIHLTGDFDLVDGR